MNEEQKERLRVVNCALDIIRIETDIIRKKDPACDAVKMLDAAIEHVETMIKEWSYAIGHPVEISNETIMEIVDRVTPIVGNIIKKRIAEGKL